MSSREPVASFLYLAIKGTVAPSSRSLIAADTCSGLADNSPAIIVSIVGFVNLGIFGVNGLKLL